jgi:hypothetical protein
MQLATSDSIACPVLPSIRAPVFVRACRPAHARVRRMNSFRQTFISKSLTGTTSNSNPMATRPSKKSDTNAQGGPDMFTLQIKLLVGANINFQYSVRLAVVSLSNC